MENIRSKFEQLKCLKRSVSQLEKEIQSIKQDSDPDLKFLIARYDSDVLMSNKKVSSIVYEGWELGQLESMILTLENNNISYTISTRSWPEIHHTVEVNW